VAALELKARLESVEQAIAEVERQKQRLLDAYLSEVLELAEFERKRTELDGRCDALLSQKRQLEASARERVELAEIADSIEKFCEQMRTGLAGATFEQKRALVGLLIDWVIVTEEEVEILYVAATSPDGTHQPFCHLRTDYLTLLQDLAPRRHLGKVARRPARAGATSPYGEGTSAQRRHSR
jgi:hypothetical protein